MLKETFSNLLNGYTENKELIAELWVEIEKNYSGAKRHYHTLTHLEKLLLQLNEVKLNILNWDTVLFSLYYHDIVYNALKSNNEEKSAELAVKILKRLAVAPDKIDKCKAQIIATKSHKFNDDSDTNHFLDADLSILGQPWESYEEYCKNVRKEYSMYPDMIYNAGRKKVLQHFLDMQRIFKTDYFYHKLELTAKENLAKELALY